MSGLALAQPPPRDTLVSPELQPAGKVTFRVRAPKAARVTLFGAWMPLGTEEPMTKDADGVWSVTVGPLTPNGYLSNLSVRAAMNFLVKSLLPPAKAGLVKHSAMALISCG